VVFAGRCSADQQSQNRHRRTGNTDNHQSSQLWEIAIKVSLCKYELPEPFDLFWDDQLQANHMTLLPISVAHTSCVTELPFHHRDPFDCLIIAQAIVEGIPVISSDRMFDQYDVARVW
jgi:PIN domain nuclease of toxin-antitoxin system